MKNDKYYEITEALQQLIIDRIAPELTKLCRNAYIDKVDVRRLDTRLVVQLNITVETNETS